jgi:hypothetical protein
MGKQLLSRLQRSLMAWTSGNQCPGVQGLLSVPFVRLSDYGWGNRQNAQDDEIENHLHADTAWVWAPFIPNRQNAHDRDPSIERN